MVRPYFLIKACENGDITTVKELVIRGVDVHYADECGFHWACYNGYIDIVIYLASLHYNYPNIQKKINIHAREERAFRWACNKGRLDVVIYLTSLHLTYPGVYKMIDIHAVDDCGFLGACWGGHTNIIFFLIKLSLLRLRKRIDNAPIDIQKSISEKCPINHIANLGNYKDYHNHRFLL